MLGSKGLDSLLPKSVSLLFLALHHSMQNNFIPLILVGFLGALSVTMALSFSLEISVFHLC